MNSLLFGLLLGTVLTFVSADFPVFGLTNSFHKALNGTDKEADCPLGIRDVYTKPVMVLVKRVDMEELTGFLCASGLRNAYENPNTRILHEMLQSDRDKKGIVFTPERIGQSTFASWPINGLVLPDQIELGRFSNVTSGRHPYLVVVADEDLPRIVLPTLHELGEFIVSDQRIDINHDKMEESGSALYVLPSAATSSARSSRDFPLLSPPLPASVARSSIFTPPLSDAAPLPISQPIYPADTFPSIPVSKPLKFLGDVQGKNWVYFKNFAVSHV